MKVAILAAGRSKRLKPINDKGLLKFNGTSLLLHRFESLAVEGFTDFIIVTGEHNEGEIKKIVQDLPYTTQIVRQHNLDEGMAGAIKAIAEVWSEGEEGLLIVSNNDTCDQSLIRALASEIEQNPDGLIVGKKVEKYFPGGYIEYSEDGFLTNIIEKPGEGNEPSDIVNLVYHYFKNPLQLFEIIQKTASEDDDVYEKSLLKLANDGFKMKVLPYSGFWQAIKKPLDIIETARFFAHKEKSLGISAKADIHPSAVITGEVVIEEGVKVCANAVIQGPAYIGKNTLVGVNSFVRDSYIGAGCVIGFSCEVARSYIGDKTWFHQNYVGDSVIGNNVSFGAGSITGNFRLDEAEVADGATKFGLVTGDNIRVGINTSFMPGIKVGSDCMIGAGLIIAEDIPNQSFVKGESKLVIKENSKKIPPRSWIQK